ncbi:MAG: biotin transporter BioY [Brevinema sp.]
MKDQSMIINKYTISIRKILLGSFALALSAQITIPLPFVPISPQTLTLTLLALTLGQKTAVSAVLVYLMEGIIGLPVFAGGMFGLGTIFGTTGGYLLGFIPATWIIGTAHDKKFSFLLTSFCIILGIATIFSCGLMQLSFFVPIDKLFSVGVVPFIPSEVIKIIIAVISIPYLKK